MSRKSRTSRKTTKENSAPKLKPFDSQPAAIIARAPLERMMAIHQLVQGKRFWNCRTLGEELEVDDSTINKDIIFMQGMRIPILWDKHLGRYVYTRPMPEFPAVQISDRELLEMAIARYACDSMPGLGSMPSLSGLVKRLLAGGSSYVTISGQEIESFFSFRRLGAVKPVTAEVFEKVNTALLESRVLKFDYCKPDGMPARSRTVRPLHLTWFDHSPYLICQEEAARAYRTFALSRAAKLAVLKRTFQRPPDFEIAKYFEKAFGIYGGDEAEEVRVRFRNPAAFFVKERFWHPSQEIIELPGDEIELRLSIAVTPEFERWILGWGRDAMVLAPQSLDDRIYGHALEIVRRREERALEVA